VEHLNGECVATRNNILQYL